MSNIYTGPGHGARITQVALFRRVWNASNKRSELTGLHLRQYEGTEMWFSCFAHILAKGQNQYSHMKYYAGNIFLLTPEEHFLFDQGTEEKRISYALDIEERTGGSQTAEWDKLKDKKEKLKMLYKEKFPYSYKNIVAYKYSPEEVMAIIGNLNKQYSEAL